MEIKVLKPLLTSHKIHPFIEKLLVIHRFIMQNHKTDHPNQLIIFRRKPQFIVTNSEGTFKFVILPVSNFTEDNLYSIISRNKDSMFPHNMVEVFGNKFLVRVSRKPLTSEEKWIVANVEQVAENMVEEGKMDPFNDYLLLLYLIKDSITSSDLEKDSQQRKDISASRILSAQEHGQQPLANAVTNKAFLPVPD